MPKSKQGNKTLIEWCDYTINPLVGCTKTRAKGAKESGCDNCYAAFASGSGRLQRFPQYQGVVDEDGEWTGVVNFVPEQLDKLFKVPRGSRVFMPSMSDPFHPAVKDEWLDQIFAAIALNPEVIVMMLTKRAQRMYEYVENLDIRQLMQHIIDYNSLKVVELKLPIQNLYLGVSTENQAAANERIPLLLKTPAVKRFLSVEPMLEDIDLNQCPVCIGTGEVQHPFHEDDVIRCENCHGEGFLEFQLADLDLVLCGGESGSKARPFHLEWARSIQQQCKDSGTAFFMKQLGKRPYLDGQSLKLKDKKGGDMSEWPEDLRVRELP